MKMKVFNPTNTVVDMTVNGVRVIVPAGEFELVNSSVGSALQEVQPQLHYSEVEELVKKPKKKVKKLIKKKDAKKKK